MHFIAGAMLGGTLGVLAMCLCIAAGRSTLRKNLCKFKNCDKSDILERLGRVDTKPNNASFRQNFTHPALKSLDRRQPACDFLPCLRKIYARKSAYYLSVNTP